ncbi:hypothetical protein HA152_07450 [Prochlorococcus marinus XMU1412]|uniref:hypothetical protein n=1 Tax=Prochlorococcus marinus TaxID=1219 RepID=UPI001ADBC663|nr:hypothetical protein [Prochlorococcus marinus]MBO8240537.1 hypothetical protein [Prochlorococcus marinus XMU1412]MBW3071772.1 hypothetical protein [Prochlorococcus marinus str. MU1412]
MKIFIKTIIFLGVCSSAQLIFIPNSLKHIFWKNQPLYIDKIRLMASTLCKDNSILLNSIEKDSILLLVCELDHLKYK